MLNLFSKGSSMKALAADLAKLRTRRSQIAKDIDHAGDTITLLRSKSKKLVLEGADRKAVADAEDAVGAAERHERNLTAALETLDEQIEKDEQELLAVQDRQQRDEIHAALRGYADGLTDEAKKVVKALVGYVEAARLIAPTISEARGLQLCLENIAFELSDATASVVAMAFAHAEQVKNGSAPAHLASPDAAPEPAPPLPITIRVFAKEHVKWRNDRGEQKVSHRWVDIDLPKATAES
jgi:hypothetical protein